MVARIRQDSGSLTDVAALPIDSEKLLALSCFIAKGLLYHHWGVIASASVPVLPIFMNRQGDAGMHDLMRNIRLMPPVHRPSPDGVIGLRPVFEAIGPIELGGGAFTYEGFHSPGFGANSLWVFNFYKARLGTPGYSETTSNVYVHIDDTSSSRVNTA